MTVDIKLTVRINSGAALLLFIASFFGLLALTMHSDRLVSVFTLALSGLTLAFAGYLKKRDRNNVLNLEAAKAGLEDETK